MLIQIDREERNTIVAALRCYQHWLMGEVAEELAIMDIATSMDEHEALDMEEIDALIEQILEAR